MRSIHIYDFLHKKAELFDLLWSLFYTTVKKKPIIDDKDIPNRFMNRKKELLPILELLPSIRFLNELSEKDLKLYLHSIHPELEYIIQWVLGTIRFNLRWNENENDFDIENETPEKTVIFNSLAKLYPVIKGFHGSSIYNWHFILRQSLQNMSGTTKQVHGAAYGSGIYLGKTKEVSLHYSGCHGIEWIHSNFVGRKVIIEANVINNDIKIVPNFCYVVPDANKVIMRKLLLV